MSSVLDDLPGGDMKIGGKSVYLYAAAIGAVAVIYMWINGRREVAPASTNVEGQEYITVPGLSGDLGDLPKATEVDPDSFNAPEPTNAEWMVKAVAWLATQGVNPLTAQRAIQLYFDGEPLSYDETIVLNKAVGHFGVPPQGLYGPPIIGTKPADPDPTPAPVPGVPAPLPAPKPAKDDDSRNHDVNYVVAQTRATYYDSPGGNKRGEAKKGESIKGDRKMQAGGKRWILDTRGRWFREDALKKV